MPQVSVDRVDATAFFSPSNSLIGAAPMVPAMILIYGVVSSDKRPINQNVDITVRMQKYILSAESDTQLGLERR